MYIISDSKRPSVNHFNEYKYLLEYSHELIKNSSVTIDTTSPYLDNYSLYINDSTGINRYIFDINEDIQVPSRTSEFNFIIVTDSNNKVQYIGWNKP